MSEINIFYLANSLSNLTGMPVRVYDNKKLVFFKYFYNFPVDPIELIKEELFNDEREIGYIATDDFFYYCFIKHQDKILVTGPSRLIKPDDGLISRLAFDLKVKPEDTDLFLTAMKSIIAFPLETIMESLLMFYHTLTSKELSLKDILINDDEVENIDLEIKQQEITKQLNNDDTTFEHNTMTIENELCRIVEHGEIDELNTMLSNMPAVRVGILSKDSLRQIKNMFIVSTTLVARAAIKGMLDIDEALSLSDMYIQKMELLQNQQEILHLQMNMIIDYCSRVAKIRGKQNASNFLISVNKYINSHLSDAIKADDICKTLFISRSVLFDKIKKETNQTLSEYILTYKINESKSLLKYSDKTISNISNYLGFSSQSHYNKTFKKIVGITPNEYRNTHR